MWSILTNPLVKQTLNTWHLLSKPKLTRTQKKNLKHQPQAQAHLSNWNPTLTKLKLELLVSNVVEWTRLLIWTKYYKNKEKP